MQHQKLEQEEYNQVNLSDFLAFHDGCYYGNVWQSQFDFIIHLLFSFQSFVRSYHTKIWDL